LHDELLHVTPLLTSHHAVLSVSEYRGDDVRFERFLLVFLFKITIVAAPAVVVEFDVIFVVNAVGATILVLSLLEYHREIPIF
jgi:hypothetical protein